jgi:hypothetical protein
MDRCWSLGSLTRRAQWSRRRTQETTARSARVSAARNASGDKEKLELGRHFVARVCTREKTTYIVDT